MPKLVVAILNSGAFQILARIVLTFVFWSAGIAGLIDFEFKMAEMRQFGLEPAAIFAIAVTVVQLGGSLLIIFDRYAWVGAGAIAVFLALTIPIAHPFWTMEEPQRTFEFYIVMEHVSLIGGMMLAASIGRRNEQRRKTAKSS